ncbi:MAG TPA: GLPGLI family protein [Flavobacterium sp.]|nr:GLPGLI family protein [Flavobacterium sp.]
MEKIFFLILFVGSHAFAQKIEVKYYENPIINNKEEIQKLPEYLRKDFLPDRFSYTLTYNNGISSYKNDDFLNLLVDENIYEEKGVLINDEVTTFRGKVLQDENRYKHKEKLYYKDVINNKVYYTELGYQVIDNPLNWNWQITDETSIIAGYTCRKAVSELMGGYFEAWYTEDIAVSTGPDKFDGLPGLILYVRTKGMEIIAQSIKNSDTLVTFERPVFEGKIYTFEELYTQPKVHTVPQATEKNSRTYIIKTN